MIPIKIETLLEGRRVEQNRIEYKEGFNPSDIVHTICAYANDIAGVDGGYLVIGVKAKDGIPVLPPEGLPQECLDVNWQSFSKNLHLYRLWIELIAGHQWNIYAGDI